MADANFEEARIDSEGRPLWLVRIPPSVHKAWNSVKEGDTLVGTIRVYSQQEGQPPRVSLHVNDQVVQNYKQICEAEVSKEKDPRKRKAKARYIQPVRDFELGLVDEVPKTRIFSEGSGGVEMQGIISEAFIAQPKFSKEYQNFAGNRTKSANTRTAVIQQLSWHDEEALAHKKRRIIKIIDPKRQQELERQATIKAKALPANTVLTEDQLRNKIFELFAEKDEQGNRQNYWTMADIRLRTGQRKPNIVAILHKLCNYHTSGPHARCYELKPEYKL
mmetsp:Transcript_16479/g.20368  ORF Transcript_16479/g.20368 Transcript_16479/m.20368 type:complete len:276 (-) Transcript_16479:416-1243(-)